MTSLVTVLDDLRGRWYDLKHDVDTRRLVNVQNLEVAGDNKKFGVSYRGTLPRTMHTLFKSLGEWDSDTSFVDLGCGKAGTLLIAAQYSFRSLIGVEFAGELAKTARRNIEDYRGALRSRNINVIHGDAADFTFPDGPLMVYFYNPFLPPVMEKVLDNLAHSLKENPRKATVIYHSWHPSELVTKKLPIVRLQNIPYFNIYHVEFSARTDGPPV